MTAQMTSTGVDTLWRAGYLPEPYYFDRDQCLGHGTYATTYAISEHAVAKITRDRTDATVAELARRHGGRNLVRVDRVWALPGQLWLIVAERLKPLPAELSHVVPGYMRQISDYGYNIHDVVRHMARGGRTPVWSTKTVWDVAAANVKGIADDLLAIGVTRFTDWHPGNIMYRPGDRVVLVDFGDSTESPSVAIPPHTSAGRENSPPWRNRYANETLLLRADQPQVARVQHATRRR